MSELRQGRVLAIEGMRGLAALYVVIGHFATMVDPNRSLWDLSKHPGWLAWITRPLWYGHLAVAAFIVISGFCLQMAVEARMDRAGNVDWKDYFVRRCRRILPPYYACLAISLAVALLVTRHYPRMPFVQYVPVTQDNVLAHLFMVHNFRPDWMYKINGVLWSIAIEFQLYFAFPVLSLGMRKVGFGTIFIASALASAALTLWIPGGTKLYFWFAGLFVLGMASARLAIRKPEWVHRGWPWIALALMYGGWRLAWVKTGQYETALVSGDVVVGLSTAIALAYVLVAPNSFTSRVIGSKPLAWLGLFSYSLYLMHHPILQVIFVHRPRAVQTPGASFIYLGLIGLPIILGLCYAFFWIFERPFMTRARKKA
ncbi:MAG: acyltransferase [Armatimonadetes bacterium]|nr:acyltransferase [Armatimonadota bacterium]